MQTDNARMMNLIMETGLKVETKYEEGQVYIRIPLAREHAMPAGHAESAPTGY